jgi:hypothetical protein
MQRQIGSSPVIKIQLGHDLKLLKIGFKFFTIRPRQKNILYIRIIHVSAWLAQAF